MKEKIINKFVYCVSFVVATIAIFLSISGIFCTGIFCNKFDNSAETVFFKIDNVIFNLSFIILFIFMLYFINKIVKKIDKKIIIVISLICIVTISFGWTVFSKAPVRADQKMIHIAATSFLNNNYEMLLNRGDYLFMHPLQLGIVYYLKLIYEVFGTTDYLVIRILNILYLVISIFMIEKISGKLLKYSDETKKMIYIMFLLFLPLMFFTTYVYGNMVGFVLSLISLYLMLKYFEDKSIIKMVLSSIIIAISIVLKSNNLIVMIAMIIIILFDMIKKFNWKNILYIILILILYKFSNTLILKYTENITVSKINEGIPMISYIDMGMADQKETTPGWYNGKRNVESIYIENNFDTTLTKEDSKETIKNRILYFIKNPSDFIIYYSKKIGSTWLEPTFQSLWINAPAEEIENIDEVDREYIKNNKILISMYEGKINKFIVKYLDIYQIIIYFTSGLYILKNIKNIDYKNFIFILIFIGGLAFHILWETKSSYAITYFVLLIPYSCLGMNIVFEYIENRIDKNREEEKDISNIIS